MVMTGIKKLREKYTYRLIAITIVMTENHALQIFIDEVQDLSLPYPTQFCVPFFSYVFIYLLFPAK